MTITHHPSDETLAAFASGSLDEARHLVVATHVSLCPRCRGRVDAFEEVGGALLERAMPTAMQSDAFERAVARTEIARVESVGAPGEAGLPAPLSSYALGPWRTIGRGVKFRSVDVEAGGLKVFMLRAEPGTRLPHHRHTGMEWTCVFEGAFIHEGGRFGPGDFDEADESVEHKPRVDEGVACVCLVALQGGIELQGFFGRLLQPFVRL